MKRSTGNTRERDAGTNRQDGAGVRVDSVARGSVAERAGIVAGDRILFVAGEPVGDLLDLHFLTSRRRFPLRWATARGEEKESVIRTGGDPLGVFPEPVRVRRCRNRCIFCFVHQLPKGMRRSLYVKDEDVRLSFLHGQYVTFSDISEEEIRKILRYRLSPLYVSIHTTDPVLRGRMLGNPHAADVMEVMRRFVSAGILLHGQIVVCPGINDGVELARSLDALSKIRPGLSTVAVVPVGLTSHRHGLPPLRAVTRDEARATLAMLVRLRRRLGDRGPDDRRLLEECTGTIIQEVEGLKHLVDEFSRFARMPALQPKPTELPRLLEGVVALYRESHPALALKTALAPDLPTLEVDPDQIKRAVLNLVDNAVEAVSGAGEVTVESRFLPETKRVRIVVSDNGVGIPPEDKDKLFLPYFSTKAAGMGLGLAIVHQIVTDHGGSIWVEDNAPKGSRFVIELPVDRPASQGEA